MGRSNETCSICLNNDNLSLALSSLRHFGEIHSFHFCISAVRQVGPSCGIAALASAFSAFPVVDDSVTFPSLLAAAKAKSWTTFGEMFDAACLATLAEKSSEIIRAEVIELSDDLEKARAAIMNCLSQGLPVLIAYDCDADFFPKRVNGLKAHWAVLNGFCVGSEKPSNAGPAIFNVTFDDAHLQLTSSPVNGTERNVFFWTLQGKSRLFRAFDAYDLLLSNFQLSQADPTLEAMGYQIPCNGNITNGLSRKIVTLARRV